MEFTLKPTPAAATHDVGSSLTSMPRIVEHTSECGRLVMHAPASLPSVVRLDVLPVEEHVHRLPAEPAGAPRRVVLQGEIIRVDGGKNVLISHGGLLMRCPAPGAGTVGQRVRTTISF